MDRTLIRRCIKYSIMITVIVTAIISVMFITYAQSKCIADTDTHITASAALNNAGTMSKMTVNSQNELSDTIVNKLSLSGMGKQASGVVDANEEVAAKADRLEKESSGNVFAAVSDGSAERLIGSSMNEGEKIVTINIDGSIIKTASNADTVEGVLRDADISIGENDSVSPALTSAVDDGDTIKIIRAVTVTVDADGEKKIINTVPVTVEEMLSLNGIPISSEDEINVSLDKTVADGDVISIGRIAEKTITKFEKVKHDVKKIKDSSMEKGTKKIVKKGSDGTANITYRIKYKYGKVLKKTVLKTDYVTKPKTEVVRVGTKKTASVGGITLGYTSKYEMVATAYCDGGNTASGPACGDGIIAVDPSVIPLGTKVYVEGYGYALAADTGGYIKGNRIDLWMSNNSICEQWGRRTVTMYVLD